MKDSLCFWFLDSGPSHPCFPPLCAQKPTRCGDLETATQVHRSPEGGPVPLTGGVVRENFLELALKESAGLHLQSLSVSQRLGLGLFQPAKIIQTPPHL